MLTEFQLLKKLDRRTGKWIEDCLGQNSSLRVDGRRQFSHYAPRDRVIVRDENLVVGVGMVTAVEEIERPERSSYCYLLVTF